MIRNKILFFLSLFIFITSFNLIYAEEKWLVRTTYFPKDEEKLTLGSLPDLEIMDENIYVVENSPGFRVLTFTKDGEFQKIIGKKGGEPGGLAFAIEISTWDKEIVIKGDTTFSFFSTEGAYLRRFNAFVMVPCFVYVKDRLYLVAANPDREYLIEVYSKKGKFLSEFGAKFKKLHSSHLQKYYPNRAEWLVYTGHLLTDGEYLYYLNSKFGKAMKFSLDGTKIADVDISGIFGERGKEVIRDNEKYWIKEGISKERLSSQGWSVIFDDAYLCGDKIYILQRQITHEEYVTEKIPQCIIKVLDKNSFKLIDEYKIKKNESEYPRALSVEENDNDLVFYFTMSVREKSNIVAEYRREK